MIEETFLIPLTQGLYTTVNGDIYRIIEHLKWYAVKGKKTFYAVRWTKIKDNPTKKRHTIWLHHLIIGKPPKGFDVDHIDGNGLNNLKSNLRIVTSRGNSSNKITHRKGHLVGTAFLKNCTINPWLSRIRLNGKQKYLGTFPTEQKAHEAYLEALKLLTS